jgi:glycosyltransferase involved in cell wall biosynthesis
MTDKRAIVASYGVPEPDHDTGSRRVFDLIGLLQAGGWTVSFVALNGIVRTPYATELQQRGVAVYGKSASDRLGSSRSLEEALATGPCELCLFAFWPVAERLMPVVRELSPQTRVVVDSIDLHLLRDARGILQPSGDGVPAGSLGAEYGSQLTGELNTYAAADAVLTVSGKEAALINDLTGQRGLARAVDLIDDQVLSKKPFRQRSGILTVGNYAHLPNAQAVQHLCCDILPKIDPRILAEHPVYVVGAGLDDTVRRFAATSPQVRMVGWVPSMRPYLERSRIAVVPLRFGAGAKGKVIEALMTGTPTVATTVGVEGLALADREHLLVADGAEAFAGAMSALLTDEKLWKSLARQGRSRAAERHGRTTIAKRFLKIIDAVVAASPKPAILPAPATGLYQSRLQYQDTQRVSARLRGAIDAVVPKASRCAVVTGGEEWILKIADHPVVGFPDPDQRAQAEGRSRGEVALSDLEELRSKGADFLVVPSRASWWVDRVKELKQHLDTCQRAFQNDSCVIYALRAGERIAESVVDAADDGHEASDEQPSPSSATRLIAFYLPQFHPIPENDAWWGPGFTEWTNVVKARPLFPGHGQPQQPAELGYYDLRVAETRAAQAELARAHGIHGFCYYHFWFNGKRLLDRPFNEVLASGQPDFPFCLCWANEPWSRRWDGSANDVLQPQHYSAEDDEAHFGWLLPALKDPRAITVDGKPLFLVYQARQLPDPARTAALWKRMSADAGLRGIHLVAVETGWDAGWDATQVGFDAKVLFQPQFSMLRTVPRIEVPGKAALQVYDYGSAWPTLANPEPVPYTRYDTVFPCWDNSPRSGDKAVVVHGSTPAAYQAWLSVAIARAGRRAPDQQLVFINAWNEWAESCQLEPVVGHGRAYLEATRRAVDSSPVASAATRAEVARSHDEQRLDVLHQEWDFPRGDAGSAAPADVAALLTAFEERIRRWAARNAAPSSERPKISIEIPVSQGSWVMPCIESVLHQSSSQWHLYLLWDGGDELSHRVLKIVEALHHPMITVFFKEKAAGIVKARQALSEASNEDYILPVDPADMLHPAAVEDLLAAAAQRSWFAVTEVRRKCLNAQGDLVNCEESPSAAQRQYQHGMVKDPDNYRQPYLLSRRAYDKTDGWEGFDDLEPAGEDCDIHLKLEEKGSIEHLELPLYYYRLSPHRQGDRLTSAGRDELWRRLADKAVERIGLPIRRVNDEPPFTYERLPTAPADVSMMDVVIAFYESDERELNYCNSRVLASKEFEFVKLSDVLVFSQTLKADLFPCDRVELTCVLLSPFDSTLSIVVTDPQTRLTVAEGRTELRYSDGPGLLTVKLSLDNKSTPVAGVLDCLISCTPTGNRDDSFNLVLQTNDAQERMAAMRMFRRSPGFSRSNLDRCVNSIKACGVPDDAIHIVNKKQSAAANRNEGFARTTRPYVCYADDDVEVVDHQTFTKLLRAMDETGAAVIGPRLITDIGSVFCADPYFDEHQHPKPRGLGERICTEYQYKREVPWLPSTLIICKSEAVKAVDGFDEGYIGSQMEDVDFCLKVRQRDLTCIYDGTVDVVHYNYQRNDHFQKNFERFVGRWRQHGHLLDSRELPKISAAVAKHPTALARV